MISLDRLKIEPLWTYVFTPHIAAYFDQASHANCPQLVQTGADFESWTESDKTKSKT